MPSVKFSKSMLLELLGRKISDEQLVNRINYLGANVESLEGDELSIEIFPNRPDFLSEQGLARALKSFLGIKTGFRTYIVKKSSVKVIVDKSVKNVRPYTACAIVKGLKFNDEKIKSIIQIQEKLHVTYGRNRRKAAIGIYPLEYIKPPIYYKAVHPEEIRFKPLDMNKELSGSQILAIHPTGREYAHLLEGLEKFPVFIDSKLNIMSMPPIINSNTVGKVSSQTRDVFIECSGFDFDYLHVCLNILVTSLAEMGGEIYSVEVCYPEKKRITPVLDAKEMKLDINYVNKILGLNLKESEVKLLLEKMGIGYKKNKALIPAYRSDILHQIDLVEDIAIAYGYENFKGKMSGVATIAAERPIEIFMNKIREVLIGAGLLEVKNYHLTNTDNQCKLMNYSAELVELENSVTQEYTVLRYWLTPSLLETLKINKHNDYPQNIFEIGTIFRINNAFETNVKESEHLAIALCGNDANFTRVKQIIDLLMSSLDLKYSIIEADHSSFIKGRVGRVLVNDEKIAILGEIHPQVLMNWSIEMPVSVIELNISELFKILNIVDEDIIVGSAVEHHTSERVHVKTKKSLKKKANNRSEKNVSKKPSKNKKK
ncbi:MAG: phenylalanine--tRNA ligase subunit beta [Candidatus Woesearchaeota archaeon]|nr:MAG: phenylalanine--tRNA ligase subunit beta [Candidatus Woesearchaeota archaeon]